MLGVMRLCSSVGEKIVSAFGTAVAVALDVDGDECLPVHHRAPCTGGAAVLAAMGAGQYLTAVPKLTSTTGISEQTIAAYRPSGSPVRAKLCKVSDHPHLPASNSVWLAPSQEQERWRVNLAASGQCRRSPRAMAACKNTIKA